MLPCVLREALTVSVVCASCSLPSPSTPLPPHRPTCRCVWTGVSPRRACSTRSKATSPKPPPGVAAAMRASAERKRATSARSSGGAAAMDTVCCGQGGEGGGGGAVWRREGRAVKQSPRGSGKL